MVTQALKAFLAMYLAALSLNLWAETLDVTVDKTRLYEDDTLEMQVKGHTELNLSFGGLLNFSMGDIPEPDLGNLEKDFEIVSRNQQYNVQIINSQKSAEVTWTYELAPKRTGTLTIPAIRFDKQVSSPLTIEVLPGSSNGRAQAPQIFLEVEPDKSSAYVQEQILVTVRLYHQPPILNGDLSEPKVDNAIIEKLGDQTKSTRMVKNQRYDVIERKYALFPQHSGDLVIPALKFEGTIFDKKKGRRRFSRKTSDSVTLKIKPIPASFSGKTWLPAMALELEEKWSDSPDGLKQGDATTRTIRLTALGLLGSALPDLDTSVPAGLKSYPEPPDRQSTVVPAGIQSTWSQSSALVATEPGTITLPELRIPWWDTLSDQERIAVIPARTLTIAATGSQTIPAQTPSQSTPAPPATSPRENEVEAGAQTGHPSEPAAESSSSLVFWKGYALVMTLLWLGTSGYFLWRLSRNTGTGRANMNEAPDFSLKQLEREARKAFETGQRDAVERLLKWLSTRDGIRYLTISDIADRYGANHALVNALKAYEAALYQANATQLTGEHPGKHISQHLSTLTPTNDKSVPRNQMDYHALYQGTSE